MDNVDITKLKHKPDIIKKLFRASGDSVFTTEDVKIYFPSRFINKSLAILGNTVKLLNFFIVVDGNGNYGKIMKPIMYDFSPNSITEAMMDGVLYTVMEFEKDDVFIPYAVALMNTNFIYSLFDEFFIRGKIPWYLTYIDVVNVLDEARYYTGSAVGDAIVGYEFITAIISRSRKDKKVQYRRLKDRKESPVYVGLNNVYYSYDTTGAKILGNYMSEGIVAALVNKETESTAVADKLRE